LPEQKEPHEDPLNAGCRERSFGEEYDAGVDEQYDQ
jgi:hypothetical protein